MNRRSAVHTLVAAGAGCVCNWFGRISWADESKDYRLRSDVVLVLLDVSVKDREGHFVSGLGKDSFEVFEDGKQQNITAFDSEDRPVSFGILMDESLSMTPKRQDVVTAAQTLIEESNSQDEVFVVHFSDRVTLGLPRELAFSGNLPQLRAALLRATPGGKTALNDALIEGLGHLRLGHKDKKTLVLVSDGGDTASKNNRKQTLEAVERSSATIYTIGLFDPDDPDSHPGFLRRLAAMSGGEAYFPASPQELPPIGRQIAREIRTRYTLGYSPELRSGGNSLRHVHVLVGARGLAKPIVRVRNAYRYDQTPNQTRDSQ